MDETAHARAAFRDGIGDITPEALHTRLDGILETASMTPGALTVLTATTLDGSIEGEGAARRGAGVQMSYEGLRLSRELIRTDPWTDGDPSEGDLNAIAAEVLVARGFEYLAHTVVAGDVVAAVRRFGRDQTRREDPDTDRAALDRGLETDFVRIAVEAGADIALRSIPEEIDTLAEELAREFGAEPLPDAETALTGVEDRIKAVTAAPETPPQRDYSRSPGT
jgi:hypothetical protein